MSLDGLENFSIPGTPARSVTATPGDDLASPASIRSWTVPRITAELRKRHVPFPATARKAELFRLLRASSNPGDAGEGPSQSGTGDIHAMLASLMTSMSTVNARLERLEAVTTTLSLTGPPPAASPAPAGLPVITPSTSMEDREVNPAHMIPEHLKRDILEGKDVNLASLLIASQDVVENTTYAYDEVSVVVKSRDARLNRKLTISEFVLAFGIYREVICAVHPDRREELDLYLHKLVDLGNKYGGSAFYDYHRSFSAKVAGAFSQYGVRSNWARIDTVIFCRHFAGLRTPACAHCSSTAHTTNFCPNTSVRQGPSQSAGPSGVPERLARDKLGRPIKFLGKSMICNNFNEGSCNYNGCKLLHICTKCFRAHAKSMCPNKMFTKPYLSTINVPVFTALMSQHPSRHLSDFLISGLTEGFHTGILYMPTGTLECPNLLSALHNPTAIDALIAQEVTEGFVLGPFKTPPFATWRTNPIGIVTGKSSQKQRLIIDLSAPHGTGNPSLNSLIPSEEFSLQYTTIDHAITAIRQAGVGAWLSKTDIANAFKLLPIHPTLWHLHGIKWSGKYYFFSRLTFGSKSSPAIFDVFAEALCWLLLNIARCPLVLHYLDDFLLVEENTSPPSSLRATIKLFNELGVPLSTKKTEGPDTIITFLGIQLDSALMQASLPSGKIQDILTHIDGYLQLGTCNRRELQSLLGSLNFAMRIIPQGRSFISRLLHLFPLFRHDSHRLSLDAHAAADLGMWGRFLSTWNGRSLFLPQLSDSSPSIWSDAASTTGFAAIFGDDWLWGGWPPEVQGLEGFSTTSALFEIYPIVAAAVAWGHLWANLAVRCYSDNQATCQIINKGRSKSLTIMRFMRRLTWLAACNNFFLHCFHVPGVCNSAADNLSRFKFQAFHRDLPSASPTASSTPSFQQLILD
ncbi:uncharacterized protein LOC122933207 [Bufo gargarizans]|uniref:uncharacterized protein LOC122933207 n=1 Tax=Bufo gargarizans TaxID=30331 RepID=UPI001CF47170|nr:uncharacterized protein LOC122933207 [Bufo gargarizans]XP_044143988.1 uncharacterized protein LOC122933207 [Bufo gargarizans]XP_044143989.1 uncharacterized protein LOC122933207 [Bufo gargarizans]XP_044143990.1 uncharacterized protein LOC122933207 [Bufo gargarizans]